MGIFDVKKRRTPQILLVMMHATIIQYRGKTDIISLPIVPYTVIINQEFADLEEIMQTIIQLSDFHIWQSDVDPDKNEKFVGMLNAIKSIQLGEKPILV